VRIVIPKARAGAKLKFTPLFVNRKNLPAGVYWDVAQKGLVLRVASTDYRSYACIYSFHSRPRWYNVGAATAIDLSTARKVARQIMNAVAEGRDPQAEKKAERMAGTFEELCLRYLKEWAIKRNRSWKQGRTLVERYCLPRWAKLKPTQIMRSDVNALLATIEAPILANQVLASASAIFSWAIRQEIITTNPCKLVARNETKSRERVLSDSELPLFWSAFDKAGVAGAALKMILLSGQRPGEISCMRREHIEANWWTMPGEPIEALGWLGTKNNQTHRVWLPTAVQELIGTDKKTGFVFSRTRGKAINNLDTIMREICATLKVERATPHDLRRTHGSTITRLGFGRDAMNRIQNHREGGIASVYDRHAYAEENKRIMETVAAHIVALAEGRQVPSNIADISAHRGVASR
jgi:integrase